MYALPTALSIRRMMHCVLNLKIKMALAKMFMWIVVRYESSANGLKFGTANHGGFRNFKIRNLAIYDTYRSAIALESVDGGFLENIDIQYVDAKNTGNAIFIRLGHRNKTGPVSTIKNVYIAHDRREKSDGEINNDAAT